MADQTVGELMRATSIGPTDLFVAEQGGVAKSVSGQIFMNWLTSFADGHGGVHNFEKIKTVGLTDTYRITLADTTTFDFTVNNGKSITSIAKTGTQGLVDTYTIKYNDGPSTTFTVTNGEKGDKGDNAYAWVKYASQKPSESSHSIGDIPDNWIGVYTGNKSAAPSDWKEYKWFQWKGEKGDIGDPARLESSEVVYQVGDRGDVTPSGSWQSNIPNTPQGKYLWTRTTNRFNTGNPVISYTVSHQGLDGSGSVSSVAGISPGPDGNVPLTAANINALPTAGGTMTGPIDMGGQPLRGLNPPVSDDQPETLGQAKQTYVAKANVVDNFTTTEPGFVADARTLKLLYDEVTNRVSMFEDFATTDGSNYSCKLQKGLQNSDARNAFIVLISSQMHAPEIAICSFNRDNFLSTSDKVSYTDGTLNVVAGDFAWANPVVYYSKNHYKFSNE